MKPQWFSGSGKEIEFDDIICEVVQHHGKNGKIFIGTDSHRAGDAFIFATVICLHGSAIQKGGRYFFKRDRVSAKKFGSLYHRVFYEAQQSLEIGTTLRELSLDGIEVHLDISPPSSHAATSSFSESIRGYVESAGFQNKIKPNSWASFSIADKHAK
jgi:predicted RNase H-related nuclease YkuK (DUF458 family)